MRLSFRTSLAVACATLGAVAVKGLFMFMQEVLVADIMQLSLFDIRNLFSSNRFRRFAINQNGEGIPSAGNRRPKNETTCI